MSSWCVGRRVEEELNRINRDKRQRETPRLTAHLLILMLGSLLGLAPTQSPAEMIRASTLYMIDGDTAAIGELRYRLVGYDTPETYRPRCSYEKALGEAATKRARELVYNARMVEFIVLPGRDKYGRGLARILIQGKDLGDHLIEERLARPYNGGRRQSWCR